MRALLGALLLLALAAPARGADEPVTVGLLRHDRPITLGLSAERAWRLEGPAGAWPVPAAMRVTMRAEGDRITVTLGPRRLQAPVWRLAGAGPWRLQRSGAPDRRYDGELTLRVASGRLLPVLRLPLERYLEAAVPDEMLPDWPAEALKAQAIAARSYMRAHPGRHAAEGYDVCDLTHCQLFRGLDGHDARTTAAVHATAGRSLRWHDQPAKALWHSTCGGATAPNEAVFGGQALPYLHGGPDAPAHGPAWCQASPHFRPWRLEASSGRWAEALRRSGLLGPGERLAGMSVSDRLAEGTVMAARLSGQREHVHSGYALWMALGPHFGWGAFKSPAFTITPARAGWVVAGTGLGHRVGMCQWGARGRALAGWKAEAILKAYFPGAVVR